MYIGDMESLFKEDGSFAGSISHLGKTAIEVYRRTAQEHLELASENLGRLANQVKGLSEVKKPEDFMNWQKEYLNKCIIATSIQTSQKLMHIFMENMADFTHMCNSMRDNAITATKSAARSATKQTEKVAKPTKKASRSHHARARA